MRRLHDLKLPLKTALAAALAMLLYQVLDLRHGYWAVISAIIVMQSNLGRSMQAAGNRLVGTAIGAAVGTAIVWTAGTNVAAVFIAVAITLWICLLAKLPDAMRLAGLTAAIVMLIREETPWQAGLARFADVALGVVVALAVSILWPSRASTDLRHALAQTFADLRALFALVAACCLMQRCDSTALDAAKSRASAHSQRNRELLADLGREPGADDEMLLSLFHFSERIRDHVFGIDYSARAMVHDRFFRLLEPELRALLSDVQDSFDFLASELHERRTAEPPALEATLENMERRFSTVRRSGASLEYTSDELLRFYSLFYRLRQLVSELTRSAEWFQVVERAA
ncbi:MAG: aromatic acid exporter family protein [Terriglobales bacterium]